MTSLIVLHGWWACRGEASVPAVLVPLRGARIPLPWRQNVVERSVIMCDSEVFSIDEGWVAGEAARTRPAVEPRPLPPSSLAEVRPHAHSLSNPVTLEEIEREAILRALRSTNWMVGGAKGAAVILGLKRTTLQARMQKLGIAPVRATVIAAGREQRCSGA